MKKRLLLLLLVIPLILGGCQGKKPVDMIPETIPGFQISPLEVEKGERHVTFNFYTLEGSEFDEYIMYVYCVIEDCVSEIEAKNEQSKFMRNYSNQTVQVEGLDVIKGRQNFEDGDVPNIGVSLIKGQYFVYCTAQEIGPLMIGKLTVDNDEYADSALKASMEVLKAIIPNLPD